MAPEILETMQKGPEASFGYLQGDSLFYGPHILKSLSANALEHKQTSNVKQANSDCQSNVAVDGGKISVPSEFYGRSVWPDCYLWSANNPQFLKEMHGHLHSLDGWVYPANYGQFFSPHWIPRLPVQMFPQSYPHENSLQDFQYFVVIDFEATCDKDKNPHPQEIIEFPSVLVNSRTGQLEDCFQIYVRPTHSQQLTDFCKDLTGIQQSQVDQGVLLSEALLMHDKWLEDKGVKHTNFAVVTWSNWDCRVMLESECRYKRITKPPYFNRWINLKVPFGDMFGVSRCNLKAAVELAGLTWEGRAHCGLDDAKNTARLMAVLMARGFKFSITNYIMWQTADHPHAVQQQQHVSSSPEGGFVLPATPYKWKTPPYYGSIPYQPAQAMTGNPIKEPHTYCFCGVISPRKISLKPGAQKASFFFGCGNWTANKGPRCGFFKWVTAAEPAKAG